MASNAYTAYAKKLLVDEGGTANLKANFKDASIQKKCFAEFVGTFMLVFTVGLTKTAGKDDSGIKVFGPTAIGCILMVMCYSLGPISGGHFNPAVTFSVLVHGKVKAPTALLYWLFQFMAGALAGIFTRFLAGWGEDINLHPASSSFFLGAPLVEIFYTFMLCFVYLNVSLSKDLKGKNNFYGVAIGFVIIAGGYGGGDVSGGAFNPAIAFGINLVGLYGAEALDLLWVPVYLLVELVGALLAVIFFQIVRKNEQEADKDAVGPSKLAAKINEHLDPEDFSEMIGAFMLTYTVGLNNLSISQMGNRNPGGVWSISACLMCMMYAVGDISGGLFNPAVTLACLGRFAKTGGGFGEEKLCDPLVSKKEGPKYMLAQLVGGALGALATCGTYFAFSIANNSYPPSTPVPPARCAFTDANGKCTESHMLFQAFFAEMIGTLIFGYVFLCVVTVTKTAKLQEYGPFAVGGCLLAVGYAFGPISGAFVNPASSLGYAVFDNFSLVWKLGPLTMLFAEIFGGILAAVLFKFVTHTPEYSTVT